MNYAIKIEKTNRYISYCDKCWYETSDTPLYLYDYEKAKEVTEQMRNHYQYKFAIMGKDGSIEIINFLSKGNPMKAEESKKKLFSFNASKLNFKR